MVSSWDKVVAEHKEQVRARIKQAALEVAVEKGLANTTMAAIAERADVSRATLYNYYRHVEGVLLAVVQDEVDLFYAHLRSQLDRAGGPRQRLAAFIGTHLEYFARPERRSRALEFQAAGISPSIRARMTHHTDRLRQLLADVLDSGRRDGVFHAEVDPDRHAELLMHLLAGAREQVLRSPEAVRTATADLDLLLTSGLLAAQPATASSRETAPGPAAETAGLPPRPDGHREGNLGHQSRRGLE
ncbi:TetR/AcrR family transcriptional regulator [Streptomyces sp. NPDC054933]